MVKRPFWISRIETAWERRSVLWLFGVRRAGKTILCKSLDRVEYFDCEQPRVRRPIDEDSEGFLDGLDGKRVVLDEIHRLKRPSELLKIAADHHPRVRIVATGSSTLQASASFRDTLTGRKADLWLTPMAGPDLEAFGNRSLPHRLLRGGLPPFFLAPEVPESDYTEWIEAFWARDLQEMFGLKRPDAYRRFVELLFAQSGGLFEATRFAAPCEISRPTVSSYLRALEATRVAHVIRPYSSRRSSEIVSAPKVYGFDTGFVCHFRGWDTLRNEDLGFLWEHYVLNEFHARTSGWEIRYWRDKAGHEVDFVLVRRGVPPIAVECKWSAEAAEAAPFSAFRSRYPKGENWVVARDVDRPYRNRLRNLAVEVLNPDEAVRRLARGKMA